MHEQKQQQKQQQQHHQQRLQQQHIQYVCDQLSVETRFPKSWLTYRGQVVNPRPQTPQVQSVTKPWS